jgi:hypothetical protein
MVVFFVHYWASKVIVTKISTMSFFFNQFNHQTFILHNWAQIIIQLHIFLEGRVKLKDKGLKWKASKIEGGFEICLKSSF